MRGISIFFIFFSVKNKKRIDNFVKDESFGKIYPIFSFYVQLLV